MVISKKHNRSNRSVVCAIGFTQNAKKKIIRLLGQLNFEGADVACDCEVGPFLRTAQSGQISLVLVPEELNLMQRKCIIQSCKENKIKFIDMRGLAC